jgi:hypothetical protein
MYPAQSAYDKVTAVFAAMTARTRESKDMRKRMVSQGFVALLIGSLGISNLASKARFDTYVAADVVTLIASGICLVAALIILVRAGKRV